MATLMYDVVFYLSSVGLDLSSFLPIRADDSATVHYFGAGADKTLRIGSVFPPPQSDLNSYQFSFKSMSHESITGPVRYGDAVMLYSTQAKNIFQPYNAAFVANPNDTAQLLNVSLGFFILPALVTGASPSLGDNVKANEPFNLVSVQYSCHNCHLDSLLVACLQAPADVKGQCSMTVVSDKTLPGVLCAWRASPTPPASTTSARMAVLQNLRNTCPVSTNTAQTDAKRAPCTSLLNACCALGLAIQHPLYTQACLPLTPSKAKWSAPLPRLMIPMVSVLTSSGQTQRRAPSRRPNRNGATMLSSSGGKLDRSWIPSSADVIIADAAAAELQYGAVIRLGSVGVRRFFHLQEHDMGFYLTSGTSTLTSTFPNGSPDDFESDASAILVSLSSLSRRPGETVRNNDVVMIDVLAGTPSPAGLQLSRSGRLYVENNSVVLVGELLDAGELAGGQASFNRRPRWEQFRIVTENRPDNEPITFGNDVSLINLASTSYFGSDRRGSRFLVARTDAAYSVTCDLSATENDRWWIVENAAIPADIAGANMRAGAAVQKTCGNDDTTGKCATFKGQYCASGDVLGTSICSSYCMSLQDGDGNQKIACDEAYNAYCNVPDNKTSKMCACLNHPLRNVGQDSKFSVYGGVNTPCYATPCAAPGSETYKPWSDKSVKCPTSVNVCLNDFEFKNDVNVNLNNVTVVCEADSDTPATPDKPPATPDKPPAPQDPTIPPDTPSSPDTPAPPPPPSGTPAAGGAADTRKRVIIIVAAAGTVLFIFVIALVIAILKRLK